MQTQMQMCQMCRQNLHPLRPPPPPHLATCDKIYNSTDVDAEKRGIMQKLIPKSIIAN